MSYSDFFAHSPLTRGFTRRFGSYQGVIYPLLAGAFLVTFLAALQQGDIKPWAVLQWVDIVGEGMTLLISLLWLHLVLMWRPPGPVTLWLASGFSLLSFGFYLDGVDELVYFSNAPWSRSLESIVTPLAILVLTYAAFLLSKEQRVLLRQQRRREAHYRNHQEIDYVTDLYNGSYFRRALEAAIALGEPFKVWLIDLDNFDAINQRFGFADGDRVLNRVANTLVASVPDASLVCRYAGDRFVVITRAVQELPALDQVLGNLLSHTMTLALSDQGGEILIRRVHVVSAVPLAEESADELLIRLCAAIDAAKRR